MAIFVSVAAASALGWVACLALSRSAARRHLAASAALSGCALLPIASGLRTGTDWTLLEWRGRPGGIESPVRDTASPSSDPRSETRSSGGGRAGSGPRSAAESGGDPVRGPAGRIAPDAATHDPRTLAGDAVSSTTARRSARTSVRRVPTARAAWASARRWVTAAYVVVAGAMSVRLLASLVAVRRLTRRAVEVEGRPAGVAGRLAGVRLLEADVACPMAVGFGAPAIVLPPKFLEAVRPDELLDVLSHEAEHLRRGDHRAILLQRILAAAYWPIPTVHLLNRELDRAREELCDNAVLTERDPVAYGETLLTVARLAGRRRSVVAPLAASVVGRGELERRVAALLDGRRDRRTRVGRPTTWAVAAGLLGGAVLLGTTRAVAVADDTSSRPSEAARRGPTKAPAPRADIRWTGIPKVDADDATLHRGVVLGPDGEPLPGATIYAASTIELLELADAEEVRVEDLGPPRAVTDEEGRFEFRAPDLSRVTAAGVRKRWETLLVAAKEGLPPGWLKVWGDDRSFREHWHPWKDRDVAVGARPPATLAGRFLLEDGTPVAGGRVRLTGLMAPTDYDLAKHVPAEEEDSLSLFETIDYAETLFRPRLLPGLTTEATTDGDGRFELAGLPEGFIAQVEVTHPRAVTTGLRVAVRPIEPVYRRPPFGDGEPTLTLYGSGFTASVPHGTVLRGRVGVVSGWNSRATPGVTVALANHNAGDGLSGQRFRTDAGGRFEVTGLPGRPEGYELAFVGSFAAPAGSRRQRVAPGEDADVRLRPARPYRLTLTDPAGVPVDRDVYSVEVQETPGSVRHDVKERFNDAERVGPGIFRGIVPVGPGAVLVKRGAKGDRPAAVDPKGFFAPGRTDWTPEEERYAYGDAWRIARPAVVRTEALAVGENPTIDQTDLAAVVFTNAQEEDGVLELKATVASDPPVDVTLVDEAGEPVAGASVERQSKRYDAQELPATFPVYGLHPERAEFLTFRHDGRGLIGTLSTAWSEAPIRVVMRPAARLIGRFTNAAGEPDFDFGARVLGERIAPDAFVAGRRFQTTDRPGERPGEFRLVVAPGAEVRGEFVRSAADRETRPPAGAAFGPLTPKPGETVDLGNLVVP